jgi:hypothetical protein
MGYVNVIDYFLCNWNNFTMWWPWTEPFQHTNDRNHRNSVYTVTRLETGSLGNQVSIINRVRDFSPFHSIKASCRAHASYPVNARDSFSRCNVARVEANHSPPFNTKVGNVQSYTCTLLMCLMALCLVKYRDNFTITSTCYWDYYIITPIVIW